MDAVVNLDTIPADIMYLISCFLTHNELLVLLRVCRSIYALVEPQIYSTIDCSRLSFISGETKRVAERICGNEYIASIVRSIALSVSFLEVGIEIHTSQLLRACTGVKQLELYPLGEDEFVQPLLPSIEHLPLERLILWDFLGSSTNPYLPLLRQHQTITQLVIHSDIMPGTQLLSSTDLPFLRSVSGNAAIVKFFRVGRAVIDIDLVVDHDCISHELPKNSRQSLIWLHEIGSVGSAPIKRLRLSIRSFNPHKVLTDEELENLCTVFSDTESFELVCDMIRSESLIKVLPFFTSLRVLHIVQVSIHHCLGDFEVQQKLKGLKDGIEHGTASLATDPGSEQVDPGLTLLRSIEYRERIMPGLFDDIVECPPPTCMAARWTNFDSKFWSQ